MPGRRRGGRRLNIVDENGNQLDPRGNPIPQDNQVNVQQNGLRPGQPARDIEGPHIGPEVHNENPRPNAERVNNRQNANEREIPLDQLRPIADGVQDPDADEINNDDFIFQENFGGVNDRRQEEQQPRRRNRRLNIAGEDNQPAGNDNANARENPNDLPSYLDYIEHLKITEMAKDEAAAKMMAAAMTIPAVGGNASVDMAKINKTAAKLMKQEAFTLMMKDPEAEKHFKKGDVFELINLMAKKQEIVDEENSHYERGSEEADKDLSFLNDAYSSFESETGKKPAQIEKENKYFRDMMKHLDHARMLAGIGEPLSGAAAKSLVIATQKYVNGGTRFAGGKAPAEANKTAMCILSHYMPPEAFKAYCNKISQNPYRKSRRDVNPQEYTHGRLMGVEKTPQEMRKDYGAKLKASFSKENVAYVVAVNNLSRRRNGGLITVVDVDEEKDRIMKEGSAFNRAWADPQNREKYKNIANTGSYALLGREVTRDAEKHSVKASQGMINRSVRTMVSTPLNQFFATEHISSILAAQTIAEQADAGTGITNKEFKDRMEMFKKDPFVLQLGARYANDPVFRKDMNQQLATKNTGYPLLKEYNSLKNPPKPTIDRNAVQNEAPQQDVRRPNPRMQQVYNQLDNLQMPMV